MLEWIRHHAVWLGAASVAMFVASAVWVPIHIARLPRDRFLHPVPPLARWRTAHPLLRVALLLLKNALGFVLLVAGLAMLVLPGQGLLAIFVALGLLDFPGKHRVQIAVLRFAPVRRAVLWLRRKAGRPPLRLPPRRRRGQRSRM